MELIKNLKTEGVLSINAIFEQGLLNDIESKNADSKKLKSLIRVLLVGLEYKNSNAPIPEKPTEFSNLFKGQIEEAGNYSDAAEILHIEADTGGKEPDMDTMFFSFFMNLENGDTGRKQSEIIEVTKKHLNKYDNEKLNQAK